MSIKILAAASLVSLAAGATSAFAASPSLNQLAIGLDLDPAGYSQADLVKLQSAKRDNDPTSYQHILEGRPSPAEDRNSAAHRQLAAGLAIDASQFSANEILRIRAAVREGDDTTVDYIVSGESRKEAGVAPDIRPAGRDW